MRTDQRHALVPSAEAVVRYFGSMGHEVREVVAGQSSKPGQVKWQLDRRFLGRDGPVFDSVAHLWFWWRSHAAWLLTMDTHFRLLTAWYRLALPSERVDMRVWAYPSPSSNERWDWSTDHVGHWPDFDPGSLPSDWAARVVEIELASACPGERCRSRFARFAVAFDGAEASEMLGAAIPASARQGVTGRL